MKINNREKVLLAVLVVLSLGLFYYKLVLSKQNTKIKNLNSKKTQYEDKVYKVKNKIGSEPRKRLEIKKLNAKIASETRDLFPKLEQEKIIIILNKMLKDTNLNGNILNFTEPKLTKLGAGSNKKEENNKNDAKDKDSLENLVDEFNSLKEDNTSQKNKNVSVKGSSTVELEKMQVTISFKGDYNGFLNFIKEVENYNKKIIINNISLNATEGSTISGNMILCFYGVPQFNVEDYFKYEFNEPHGKDNPFGAGVSSVPSNVSLNEEKKEEDDFSMSLRAETSDLPTLIFGKSRDTKGSTYVYADSNKEENVYIYFWEKSGKYFCKYKTSRDKYPVNFNNGEVFKPNDKDINIKIYSNPRNGDNDKSSVNLTINNATALNVNIKVENDDKIRPRVNIIKEKGSINVE